jgi:hypothetical protein
MKFRYGNIGNTVKEKEVFLKDGNYCIRKTDWLWTTNKREKQQDQDVLALSLFQLMRHLNFFDVL